MVVDTIWLYTALLFVVVDTWKMCKGHPWDTSIQYDFSFEVYVKCYVFHLIGVNENLIGYTTCILVIYINHFFLLNILKKFSCE